MFENPRRGRQERKFTTNVPKFLDLKFRTDIFRKSTLGAPDLYGKQFKRDWKGGKVVFPFFRGHCDRYFWDIRLKIHVLPNFDMLLQLVLTKKNKKTKNELFSCLPKVDHVINQCIRPIDVIFHISQKRLPNLVDSSWLWWIMCGFLANQRWRNILNEWMNE